MEIPKVKRLLVSSGKEGILKSEIVQLRRKRLEILKKELELWNEWENLIREERERGRYRNSRIIQTIGKDLNR